MSAEIRTRRVELHAVAGSQEKRLNPRTIERLHGGSTHQLPAAWSLAGIDASLNARDPHRTRRNASSRRRAARRSDPWIDGPEVRKARNKSEHEDTVGTAGVKRHHFCFADSGEPG